MKILSQYSPPFLPLIPSDQLAVLDESLVQVFVQIEQREIVAAMEALGQLPHRTAVGLAYVVGIELLKVAPTSEYAFELLASCTHYLDRACQEHPNNPEPFAMAGMAYAMLSMELVPNRIEFFALPQMKQYLQAGRDAMEKALQLDPQYESLLGEQIQLISGQLEGISSALVRWAEKEQTAINPLFQDSKENLAEAEKINWHNAADFLSAEWEKKRDKFAGYGLAICYLQMGISNHDEAELQKAMALLEEILGSHVHFHQAHFFLGQTHERLAELNFRLELESEGEDNRTEEMIAHYQKALYHYERAKESGILLEEGLKASLPRVKERLIILESLHLNTEKDPQI